MASEGESRGKKRSKAFYRKSAYGNKKQCTGANILEPGIRGFLVLCNHDERSAVRESYNILNEYADSLYGPDKNAGLHPQKQDVGEDNNIDEEDDCDDIEKALKKEIEGLKTAHQSVEKRFQNVATKSKNCVFIRTNLENPVEVTSLIMEDIAQKHLRKARYAARILPILGTSKANTKDIEKLASDVLKPLFSKESNSVPSSYTVLFKMRNNQGTSCGRDSVIPAIKNVMKDINPDVTFSWTEYAVAVMVEVVCTVCCIGLAPDYLRLRKYNLQELQQGPKECEKPALTHSVSEQEVVKKEVKESDLELEPCPDETEKTNTSSLNADNDSDKSYANEIKNDKNLSECVREKDGGFVNEEKEKVANVEIDAVSEVDGEEVDRNKGFVDAGTAVATDDVPEPVPAAP